MNVLEMLPQCLLDFSQDPLGLPAAFVMLVVIGLITIGFIGAADGHHRRGGWMFGKKFG